MKRKKEKSQAQPAKFWKHTLVLPSTRSAFQFRRRERRANSWSAARYQPPYVNPTICPELSFARDNDEESAPGRKKKLRRLKLEGLSRSDEAIVKIRIGGHDSYNPRSDDFQRTKCKKRVEISGSPSRSETPDKYPW